MKDRAPITAAQLGALTRGALIKVPYGNRGEIELHHVGDDNTTAGKIATNDDGEELMVVLFPDDVFEAVLSALDIEDAEDRDRARFGDTVWFRESEIDPETYEEL